jgi:hypothetical protein
MPFSYAFMKAEWQAPRHGSGRLHLLAPASATGDFAMHDGFAKHNAKPKIASPKRLQAGRQSLAANPVVSSGQIRHWRRTACRRGLEKLTAPVREWLAQASVRSVAGTLTGASLPADRESMQKRILAENHS